MHYTATGPPGTHRQKIKSISNHNDWHDTDTDRQLQAAAYDLSHIHLSVCAKMPKQRKNTRSAQNSTIEIIFISYFKLCHLNFFDLTYPTLILTPKLSKSPEKLIKSNKKTSESSVCVLKYLLQTGKFTKKINKSLSNT